MSNYRITLTTADEALYAFDAENNVEPFRTIARRMVQKYGDGQIHSLVDAISSALEDAYNLGEKRAPFVHAAVVSHETVARAKTDK